MLSDAAAESATAAPAASPRFSERVRIGRVRVAQSIRLWQHRHVDFGNIAKRNYLPSGYANVSVHDSGLLTMALNDITRDVVLQAITEYDRLGQEAFLERYGFDRARQYLLVHDGKRYASKAIVGVAHGFLQGKRPLASDEFNGGEATVGRLLRRLGLTVQVGEAPTADRLVRLLSKLQVYRKDGLPALYQPVTLLWAFGRACDDEPRPASWAETRQQVSDLFNRYGRPWEGDRVYYPVAALHGADL